MPLGAWVRGLFGPFEPQVANAWRALFVDLDQWTSVIRNWSPAPRRILEVGCGEGYSTARLAETFPGIPIDAIDIAGHIGRLYDGPPGAVTFRIAFVQEVAAERPGGYDLVVLTDVLHHVPQAERAGLLDAIHAVLAPGGVLAFKDWERAPFSPVHYLVHGADRWLTGDRVAYLRPDEARALVAGSFGPGAITAETTIRPWSHNYAFRILRD